MTPTSTLPLFRSKADKIDLISRWSDFKLISYDLKAADDYDIDIAFVDSHCLLFYSCLTLHLSVLQQYNALRDLRL